MNHKKVAYTGLQSSNCTECRQRRLELCSDSLALSQRKSWKGAFQPNFIQYVGVLLKKGKQKHLTFSQNRTLTLFQVSYSCKGGNRQELHKASLKEILGFILAEELDKSVIKG